MASVQVRSSVNELKTLMTLLKELEELEALEAQDRDNSQSLSTLQEALQSVDEDLSISMAQLTKYRQDLIDLQEKIAGIEASHQRALITRTNLETKIQSRQDDAGDSVLLLEQISAKRLQADLQYKKWLEVGGTGQNSPDDVSSAPQQLNSPESDSNPATRLRSTPYAFVVPMKRRHSSSEGSTAGLSYTQFASDDEDGEESGECTTLVPQPDLNGSTTPPQSTDDNDPSSPRPNATAPHRKAILPPTCTRCYREGLKCSGSVVTNLSCDLCRPGMLACSFTYSRKSNPTGKVNPLAHDELRSLMEDYPLLGVREIYERRMFGEVGIQGLRSRLRQLGFDRRSRGSDRRRDAAGGSV